MTEEKSGSATTDTGSASTGNEEMISYSTHKRLLSQRKSDQEKMRDLEKQLETINTETKSNADAELEKQGEYKKLLETRNAELDKARGDNSLLATELTNTWKKQAFFGKLKGKLRKPEYEKFVDYSNIALDPETKLVDDESVNLAVNSFMDNYADLLETTSVRTLPANAPTNQTPQSINSMSQAERQVALNSELTKLLSGV